MKYGHRMVENSQKKEKEKPYSCPQVSETDLERNSLSNFSFDVWLIHQIEHTAVLHTLTHTHVPLTSHIGQWHHTETHKARFCPVNRIGLKSYSDRNLPCPTKNDVCYRINNVL